MRVRRRGVLVGAVVALCLAAPASAAAEPGDVTLRLSDLPPGFAVGDDSGCGLGFGEEGLPRVLGEIQRDHRYAACGMEFERLWPSAAASPLVESYAFEFEAPEGADAAFQARRPLIAYVTGLAGGSLKPRSVADQVGEATAVYRTNDALVRGRGGGAGVVVVWRTGPVLSLVFVAGRGPGDGEEVFRLARVQQDRVTAPTPLTPGDNDDRQVALDHPQLRLPVWWLGDRFVAPAPLPALVLEHAAALDEGLGWDATIDYRTDQNRAGVTLGLWRPRAFARFKRTRLGRLVRRQRCAQSTRIRLPAGRAVIFAGYGDPPRRCDRRAPDRFLAHVYLDGAAVTVNVPVCFRCVAPVDGDPYNTEAGMRAVAQALVARP